MKKRSFKKFNIDIDFGIGIASYSNQIICRYGKKYDQEQKDWNVVGRSINEASTLSKYKNTEIRINENVFLYLSKKHKEENFFKEKGSIQGIKYWEGSIIKEEFYNWINNN